MIRRDSSPVGWTLLVDELEEANEQLINLISEFNTQPVFDEIDFRMHLGHIYSHLNRAWNRRNREADLPGDVWEKASQFPPDVDIV